MLASFFVVQGAKSALKPDEFVASAEPVAERLVPLAQRVAPASVSNYIPDDTKKLVRYSGIAQVVGGLGLATGIGRRGSSALLSASMVPHVLASRAPKNATPEQKSTARALLLRNVALLGATLLAAQDTQGRPSLAYRASREQRKLSKAVHREQNSFAKAASEKRAELSKVAGEKQQEFAEATRKQRKQLATQGKQWAKDADKQRAELAKQARKQQKVLAKRAAELTERARSQAGDVASQLESALG